MVEAARHGGTRPRVIMVSGGSRASQQDKERAEEVGRLLAEAGAVVLTGGGTGVMEAACRGARAAGGITLGVLPGSDASQSPPNEHVSLSVFTGMGDARNSILVRTADAVIAIGGSWGTLSEIALASKVGRPIILLGTWGITPPDRSIAVPPRARDAQEAVSLALKAAGDP
jgi:uncharacterized protein (TIGR00725 family)